jgi:mRNA-degrading endonuclease RelE of RelBE toxin-antitoxin system
MIMKWHVVFKPQALEHLRWLPVHQQRIVTDGIRRYLVENDPRIQTRNKFRLRRSSTAADYELRLGSLRVLYRIEESVVSIAVVGLKQGNTLIVRGEEFVL